MFCVIRPDSWAINLDWTRNTLRWSVWGTWVSSCNCDKILWQSTVIMMHFINQNCIIWWWGQWRCKNRISSRKILTDEPCKCLDISSSERHYSVVYTFYKPFFPLSFCLRRPDSFSSVLVKDEPGRSHYEHWCSAKGRRDEWSAGWLTSLWLLFCQLLLSGRTEMRTLRGLVAQLWG